MLLFSFYANNGIIPSPIRRGLLVRRFLAEGEVKKRNNPTLEINADFIHYIFRHPAPNPARSAGRKKREVEEIILE
jgi:hypothetical protein